MRGLAILLLFNLIGLLLQAAGTPLPSNVIGLILFTFCLFAGIIKLEWVEESAHFLLRHMLLFFAPAIVAALPLLGLYREDWSAIAVSLAGSLFIVMLSTGAVATWLIPPAQRRSEPETGYEPAEPVTGEIR